MEKLSTTQKLTHKKLVTRIKCNVVILFAPPMTDRSQNTYMLLQINPGAEKPTAGPNDPATKLSYRHHPINRQQGLGRTTIQSQKDSNMQ